MHILGPRDVLISQKLCFLFSTDSASRAAASGRSLALEYLCSQRRRVTLAISAVHSAVRQGPFCLYMFFLGGRQRSRLRLAEALGDVTAGMMSSAGQVACECDAGVLPAVRSRCVNTARLRWRCGVRSSETPPPGKTAPTALQ